MGNWHISVIGVGAHHNGLPQDADAMAKAFVEALVKEGHHTIESATFTYGGKQELLPSVVAVGGSITDYVYPSLQDLVEKAGDTTARGGKVISQALTTILSRANKADVLDTLASLGVTVRGSDGALLAGEAILRDTIRVYEGASSKVRSDIAELLGGVYLVNVVKAILAP